MTAVRSNFTIEQNWQGYSQEEHAIWRLLFERQQRLLVGRACREYLEGLGMLGVAADGIPDFRGLSEVLDHATGWRIVAVPGLVPDDVFFAHLARRRFPSTCFIRRRDQLDYLEEPNVFHDVFGHVPVLSAYTRTGSDLLLVHAPGATRPMTPWRAGILRRYAAARVMKTSVSWALSREPVFTYYYSPPAEAATSDSNRLALRSN